MKKIMASVVSLILMFSFSVSEAQVLFAARPPQNLHHVKLKLSLKTLSPTWMSFPR